MNDLKSILTKIETEERNLNQICSELEEMQTNFARVISLKENKKATEVKIALYNTTLEWIQNKNPKFYNIQCQLCHDFAVCDVSENRFEPCNCQRGFKLIKLEEKCNFLHAGKCIFGAIKQPDGRYLNQKFCLPGSCPLKITPEYLQWRKI